MKKWLIAFIIGMCILNLASLGQAAAPAQVSISPSRKGACRRSTASYQVNIENMQPVRDTFEITTSAPKFILLSENKITLSSGESKDIYLWYTPDETVEPGTYDFEVRVTATTSGETITEKGTIEVLPCRDIDLTPVEDYKKVCINEEAEYKFKVINNGREPEKVELSAEKGKLSKKEIKLNPGETETVSLTLSSSKEEKLNVQVTAESKNSYAKSSKLVTLRTEKCYSSDLEITPESKEICEGLEGTFKVTLKNKGTKEDTFTLTSSRGELEDTSLTVKPGKTAETELKFSPTKLGDYTITVEAKGKSSSSDIVDAKGINCKDVAVIIAPGETKICENDKTNYLVTVKNIGQVKDTYRLVSNLGILEKNSLTLDAGNSEKVNLKIDGSALEEGKQRIRVRARSKTIENVEDYSDSVIDIEDCYNLNLSVSKRTVCGVTCSKANNITLYTIELRNTGSRENTYKVEIEGPDWVSLMPEKVKVDPGETGKSYLYASAPYNTTGKFNLTVVVSDKSKTVMKTVKKELIVGKLPLKKELPKNVTKKYRPLKAIEKFLTELPEKIQESAKSLERLPENTPLIIAIIIGLIVTGVIIYLELR